MVDAFNEKNRRRWLANPHTRKWDTLREYLLKGNPLRDIDASGEMVDFACGVCCGGYTITEEGEKRWGKVLDCPIIVNEKESWGIILDAEIFEEEDFDEFSETGETERFLLSFAGYCSEDDFDKWFKEIEEEQ